MPLLTIRRPSLGAVLKCLTAESLAEVSLHITVGSSALTAAATVEQRVELLRGKGAPRFKRLCALLREYLGRL